MTPRPGPRGLVGSGGIEIASPGVISYLDKLFCGGPLLERAAQLVRGEDEVGVFGDNALLDSLHARAVPLFQGEDCLEHHLLVVWLGQKRNKTKRKAKNPEGLFIIERH